MTQEQGEYTSPEERTAQFFSIKAEAFSERLKPLEGNGMVIASSLERKIRVVLAEPYSRVGDYYKKIGELKPGTLWNPAKRVISQSLIVTPSEGGNGSCVRLLQAEFFDPETGDFVAQCNLGGEYFGPREGSIAKYLQLNKGGISELKFVDNTEILQISNTQHQEL